MNNFLNYIKRPLNLCIIILSILTVAAVVSRGFNEPADIIYMLFNFSLIFIFNTFLLWIFTFYNIKKFNTSDSIISSFILFLLLDPRQNILMTVLIAIIVMLSRIFLRYKNSPVFNPASLSIAAVVLISHLIGFRTFISWWGTSFAPRFTEIGISIAIILTLPFGIYLAKRFSKLFIVYFAFIFAAIFFIIDQLVFNQITFDAFKSLFLYNFLEGTMIFAVLIMLCEPKTSPLKKFSQIIYALFFALFWVILYHFHFNNSLIYAILIVNVYTFLTKIWPKKSVSAPAPIVTASSVPAQVTSPPVVDKALI